MLHHLLPFIGAFCVTTLAAQVHVDAPIILSGTEAADRQLIVAPATIAYDEVLSVGIERSGTHRLAAPAAGTTWEVELAALNTEPTAGTNIVVLAPGPTSGAIALRVNGHGPFPLVSALNIPFDGQTLEPGNALSLVSDGTRFHVVNGEAFVLRPCPSDMVAVNDHFCTEVNQRAASTWFAAITTCAAQNRRVCGWGEFITLCRKATTLGLSNTTNDWEWTDDACNENGAVRTVGLGGCIGTANAHVTNHQHSFRCCYTR